MKSLEKQFENLSEIKMETSSLTERVKELSIHIFYGPKEPHNSKDGDVWFNTSDKVTINNY